MASSLHKDICACARNQCSHCDGILQQLVSTGQIQELKRLKINAIKAWHCTGKNLLHIAALSNQVDVIRYLAGEAKVDINGQDSEGNTPLHLAVTSGHAEATNALLQCGADDTVCNKDSDPTLHLAIQQGSQGMSVLSELVKHPNVNLHIQGCRNYSTLHVIASTNNVEALQLLYNSTSNIKLHLMERDKNGVTVLHLAAKSGSHEVLEFLLSKCEEEGLSSKELLRCLVSESRSPLHYAVEHRHTECVRVLLKHGGDPTQVTNVNCPPLHMACWHGNVDAVKMMVDTCGQSILQLRDQDGKTVLHYLSSVNGKELASYLVENGAPINGADNVTGCSPLAAAIKLGNLVTMNELLRLKADPLHQDSQGNNLLHLAVVSKKSSILRTLVSYESAAALASIANSDGNYPIHLALKLGIVEMVSALFEVTSKMFEDGEGNSYLHLAALLSDEAILAHLLCTPEAIDIINASNHEGFTPLHYAAMGSSPSAVRKLSEHGAVIHKSNTGLTPFMCACSKGNLEAAKFLYHDSPFQRDYVDHHGCTALHASVEGGKKQLITFCLDEGVAITLNDDQLSFLDKILDMDNKELAKTVISHKRWAECIDVYCPSKPHPILRILDQMPDIYGIMLDNCLTKSSLSPHHRDYWEEYNFKCLVLQQSQQPIPDNGGEMQSLTSSDIKKQLTATEDSTCLDVTSLRHLNCSKKHKEPFDVCIKLNRTCQRSYLVHPVVASYLKMKWEGFSMYAFTAILLCHFLFALSFSIFLIQVPQPLQSPASMLMANVSENASIGTNVDSNNYSLSSSAMVLLVICAVLSALETCISMSQIVTHGLDLILNFADQLNVWSNFIATINVIIFLISVLVGGLDSALWNAAALGVFFAWVTFNLALRMISVLNLGIYVIMMTRITVTILKVMIVFIWVFFSFSMAFYVLVGTVDGLHYDTVGLSLYSNFHALIATTDYLKFADLQQAGKLRFSVLVFILLVALIILVPIVFVNILIGLAVGDIAKIKEDAIISRQSIELRALSAMNSRFLPSFCKKRICKSRVRSYPNRYNCSSFLSMLYHKTFPTKLELSPSDQLSQLKEDFSNERQFYQKNLNQLQDKMNSFTCHQTEQLDSILRLEAMVTKLTNQHEAQSH